MLKVKKIGFFVASIFSIYVKFLDLLFLNKFKTVSLALPSSPLTILLSLALNTLRANFLDDPDILNRKKSDIAVLLKL